MVAVLCEARLLPWKMIFAKIEWKDTSKNPQEVKTTPSRNDLDLVRGLWKYKHNSIEVEFRTKTPLNLRIVLLVKLKNGLELLCSTTEAESQLIDEKSRMYISFKDEKSHFFDKETKRNLE